MREVCFLIGEGDVVLWSDASDSPVLLPDSRARWEAIWSRRDRITEIAHSHPVGPIAFSREDETTMAALVSALGRSVVFSVVAPNGMVRRTEPFAVPHPHGAAPDEMALADTTKNEQTQAPLVSGEHIEHHRDEPWWASLLRLSSGMTKARVAAATSTKEK